MKKFWKILGLGALAVGLTPYKVEKNEETGENSYQALLWRITSMPGEDGEKRAIGISLGEGTLTSKLMEAVEKKEEPHLFSDELSVEYAAPTADGVRAAVEEARFAQVVGMMKNATQAEMNTKDVPGIVKLASREFHITDDKGEGILQHLIEGKDLTLYGLSNAVTRHSQDVENYDRATQLESIGYNILSMPARQWNRINQVAA